MVEFTDSINRPCLFCWPPLHWISECLLSILESVSLLGLGGRMGGIEDVGWIWRIRRFLPLYSIDSQPLSFSIDWFTISRWVIRQTYSSSLDINWICILQYFHWLLIISNCAKRTGEPESRVVLTCTRLSVTLNIRGAFSCTYVRLNFFGLSDAQPTCDSISPIEQCLNCTRLFHYSINYPPISTATDLLLVIGHSLRH